jgi:hypothetical protein
MLAWAHLGFLTVLAAVVVACAWSAWKADGSR